MLPIDSLVPARSPRLDGENVEHTRALAESQVPLPPIVVQRDTLRIIDGMHRVAAARLRGDTTIRAQLFHGQDHEAFALAVRANLAHGLPLSYADRVAAAAEIIRCYPRWSDRAVAATVGLSATTVSGIRDRTLPAADVEERRMGLDGRVRPVDARAGRERVRAMIIKSPDASLRQLAKAAGVSPNTVRNVRKQMQHQQDAGSAGCKERGARGDGNGTQVPGCSVDAVLRRLSQDPSLRLTESGRVAIRWFFSHVVRRGEWAAIVDSLPPHTAFVLAEVAQQCAAEWKDLARDLSARTRCTGRPSGPVA